MAEQNLADKVVVITGATGGIGQATATALAARGAHVILACRNPATAESVAQHIRRTTGNADIRCAEIDLSDLQSVQRSSAALIDSTERVDILINNAGGTFMTRSLTAQGIEQTFAVNYLGQYALTRLLLPHLRRSAHPRVISVSSNGHKFTRGIRWDDLSFAQRYSPMGAYANAKLAQILFTRELADRYSTDGLLAAAVHPGFVASNFYDNAGAHLAGAALRAVARTFAKTPEEGAQTSTYLASADNNIHTNGGYWAKCRPAKPSKAASDSAAAQRLWQLSDQMVTKSGISLPND